MSKDGDFFGSFSGIGTLCYAQIYLSSYSCCPVLGFAKLSAPCLPPLWIYLGGGPPKASLIHEVPHVHLMTPGFLNSSNQGEQGVGIMKKAISMVVTTCNGQAPLSS